MSYASAHKWSLDSSELPCVCHVSASVSATRLFLLSRLSAPGGCDCLKMESLPPTLPSHLHFLGRPHLFPSLSASIYSEPLAWNIFPSSFPVLLPSWPSHYLLCEVGPSWTSPSRLSWSLPVEILTITPCLTLLSLSSSCAPHTRF